MNVEPRLFREILKAMPIPCVDIIALDLGKKALLLRRKNEPAAGQWWFPRGGVLFNEKSCRRGKT
jgi:ADP-ribose pyrophosphatase YjhB (NUDIX family)